jgi:hypothetical protein
MNYETIEQELLACISCGDATVENAARLAREYTDMFRAGQINKEEYEQLLVDIQSGVNITLAMSEMSAKQKINTAITALINLASVI